jgi:hypothetical protein
MQMEEPPASQFSRPVSLAMPSPAEMGLGGRSQPKELDWVEVRRRMDRLGATGFDLKKLPAGGYRVTFQVPTAVGMRPAEAEAANEADALNSALAQAERWAGR